VAPARLTLPAAFAPDHPTSGLPGYPARDFFAPAGTEVEVQFWGIVRRISGRDCAEGGTPGSAYGRSVYVLNRANNRERFITHLDSLRVEVGDRVKPGSIIGTVCRPPIGSPRGSDHVHLGLRR
jgi:murein DD-endopeptidase MepM/ murein hydrolase activator NlpD